MFKYLDLLRSNNKKVLRNLTKFVHNGISSDSVCYGMMGIFVMYIKVDKQLKYISKDVCWYPPHYCWKTELLFPVFIVKFDVYVWTCMGPKAMNIRANYLQRINSMCYSWPVYHEIWHLMLSCFVITGGTWGCHNDNLRCHHWWQSWHHDNSWFSVWYWIRSLAV